MIALLIRAALILGVLVYAAGAEAQALMQVETKVYGPDAKFGGLDLVRQRMLFGTMVMCRRDADLQAAAFGAVVTAEGRTWYLAQSKRWHGDVLFLRVFFCSPYEGK